MPFPRPSLRTLDDAGAPVRVFGVPTFDSWRTAADPRLQELQRRITFVLAERRFRLNEPEALLMAAPAAAIMLAMILHNIWPSIPTWAIMVCCLLPALPAVRLGMRLSIARRSRELTLLMLEEGLCPVCGYNFFGLDLSGELISCPECGASWRTGRITRVLPIDETTREPALIKALRQPLEMTTAGIDDSRGARVGLVDPRLRAARRRTHDPVHLQRLAAARRDLARIGRTWRIALAALLLFGAIIMTIGLLRTRLIGAAALPPFVFVGPICMAGIALGAYFGRIAYSRRRVRSAMLSHALCPSCAAPLDNLPPDPADGCVACETCHAAWRFTPPAEAR